MKNLCKFTGLIPSVLFLLSACSGNVANSSKVGECIRHKWQNGTFRVKKTGDNQIVVEEILPGMKYGKIKVISHLYGGWYKYPCPKNDRELMDGNKK